MAWPCAECGKYNIASYEEFDICGFCSECWDRVRLEAVCIGCKQTKPKAEFVEIHRVEHARDRGLCRDCAAVIERNMVPKVESVTFTLGTFSQLEGRLSDKPLRRPHRQPPRT